MTTYRLSIRSKATGVAFTKIIKLEDLGFNQECWDKTDDIAKDLVLCEFTKNTLCYLSDIAIEHTWVAVTFSLAEGHSERYSKAFASDSPIDEEQDYEAEYAAFSLLSNKLIVEIAEV